MFVAGVFTLVYFDVKRDTIQQPEIQKTHDTIYLDNFLNRERIPDTIIGGVEYYRAQ